ncbi:MAG: PASTA domain-containing protein [Ruminococcaceae bacterium]|nr:PASTA domain-containing protein [Oscillospiraceae bacterium]
MSTKPGVKMTKRIFWIMVALIVAFTGVSGARLAYIMIIKGDFYQSKASEQQLYDSLITAPRGDIFDKNGNVLATSAPAWTIYLTPNGINKMSDSTEAKKIRATIAQGLSEILELDYDDVYKKTEKNNYYVTLKKKVDKETTDKVREFISENKDIEVTKYIGIDETTKRFYPNDSLASTIIGFVGDDNQGLAGIESYYDNKLTGMAGRVVAAKNAAGTDMPFTYQQVEEAVQGNSLVLTIDSYIQYVCEKYLDEAIDEYLVAERGAIVVMDVNTGAILANAVSGDFDPNSPFTLSEIDNAKLAATANEDEKAKLRTELLNRQWRNKAVSDTYEPGSVFKIFTAATALEENLINKNNSFTCNYSINVAGQTYHCWKAGGHGTQNLSQSIANSCNPAFIMIGQLIGAKTFSKYFNAFGLNTKTGIDLPGEASSTYHREEKMGITELSSSSFGQTFNITPIQTLTIASAAVNGGYIVQPHVVSEILDADGKVAEVVSTDYKRQVISNSTSETMRELLEFVINNGAKNGIVAGYRVGGKTGTSQKLSKILATGDKSLYIGSYVGIAPIDDPQIAVLVMLDEPKGERYYGGAICAPVGAQVMGEVLPYLGYEPQYTEEQLKKLAVNVPNTVGDDIATAKGKITTAKLTYRVVGTGTTVTSQLPEEGSRVYNGGTVILYTDGSESETSTVPNLVGLTATEANTAAVKAGLNIEFSGNTTSSGLKAYKQSIKEGTQVPSGTIITVYFLDESTIDMATQ